MVPARYTTLKVYIANRQPLILITLPFLLDIQDGSSRVQTDTARVQDLVRPPNATGWGQVQGGSKSVSPPAHRDSFSNPPSKHANLNPA